MLLYLVRLADRCNIDLASAQLAKMARNRLKYPADKVYGKSDKYTAYLAGESTDSGGAAAAATTGSADRDGSGSGATASSSSPLAVAFAKQPAASPKVSPTSAALRFLEVPEAAQGSGQGVTAVALGLVVVVAGLAFAAGASFARRGLA